MTERFYFPRLERREASRLLEKYTDIPPKRLVGEAAVTSDRQYWYQTAPSAQHVRPEIFVAFQVDVRDLAHQNGYPTAGERRAPSRLTAFDRSLTARILDLLPMIPSEASVDSVWSFITLVVVPDVAFWRFPNRGKKEDFERILGRPRNVFRRLWWRAYGLGGGDSGLAAQLLEDEAVGLFERTRLAGNRRLLTMIAETHLQNFSGSRRRTEILRDAMKRVSRLHAFVAFHALSDVELRRLVEDVFVESAAYLLEE